MSETPKLSPYIGHIMVMESPAHGYAHHRLLGGEKRPPTDATDKGSLIHALLLGKGDVEVLPEEFADFRKKDAQALRDAARKAGKTPVLAHKHAEAMEVVERIRKNLAGEGITLEGGNPEVRLEWTEPSEYGDVECVGVVDWLRLDRMLLYELKTGDGSVHPDAFSARLIREGGAVQHAAYLSAVQSQSPDLAGRVACEFLAVETRPPYVAVAYELAGTMQELGESRWRRAVAMWARSLHTGEWPGYVRQRIEAPTWALNKELEQEYA